jgi:hypothetical protein
MPETAFRVACRLAVAQVNEQERSPALNQFDAGSAHDGFQVVRVRAKSYNVETSGTLFLPG